MLALTQKFKKTTKNLTDIFKDHKTISTSGTTALLRLLNVRLSHLLTALFKVHPSCWHPAELQFLKDQLQFILRHDWSLKLDTAASSPGLGSESDSVDWMTNKCSVHYVMVLCVCVRERAFPLIVNTPLSHSLSLTHTLMIFKYLYG